MVEVPAAALRAADLLRVVDFVSVGSNDLAQYTFATDRADGELSDLLDPWQPAFLDLVATVLRAGAVAGRPVTVCGEAPSDPLLALVLVGLGAAGLSMTPRALRRRTDDARPPHLRRLRALRGRRGVSRRAVRGPRPSPRRPRPRLAGSCRGLLRRCLLGWSRSLRRRCCLLGSRRLLGCCRLLRDGLLRWSGLLRGGLPRRARLRYVLLGGGHPEGLRQFDGFVEDDAFLRRDVTTAKWHLLEQESADDADGGDGDRSEEHHVECVGEAVLHGIEQHRRKQFDLRGATGDRVAVEVLQGVVNGRVGAQTVWKLRELGRQVVCEPVAEDRAEYGDADRTTVLLISSIFASS